METRMIERCATCAFRPGTEAANSWNTQMKIKLSIAACVPFYCHEQQENLCAGFSDGAVNAHEHGKWEMEPWRRGVLLGCLDALYAAEDGKPVDIHAAVTAAMEREEKRISAAAAGGGGTR